MEEYLTLGQLRQRWSSALVRDFAPPPDRRHLAKGRSGRTSDAWSVAAVEAVEVTAAFQAAFLPLLHRREAAWAASDAGQEASRERLEKSRAYAAQAQLVTDACRRDHGPRLARFTVAGHRVALYTSAVSIHATPLSYCGYAAVKDGDYAALARAVALSCEWFPLIDWLLDADVGDIAFRDALARVAAGIVGERASSGGHQRRNERRRREQWVARLAAHRAIR